MGAVRDWAAASVAFQTALAEARGLSFVEARTLDLLERSGPLTAGELSTRSRLAPASVTGLVDRLVRKGAVRRSPHPEDGRRVLIETIANGAVAPQSEYCRDLTALLAELCAQYTNEQLAVIASFATAATKRSTDATTRLTTPADRTPKRRT
jgi:DNA-binding MarR family transcriptional regulator